MRRVKFTCVTQVHIIIIIVFFFNYINTIELRQWSSQSIRRKRTNYIRNIKWKHIHKITVYTPKTITKMINTLYIYEVDTVCLFFSLFFFLSFAHIQRTCVKMCVQLNVRTNKLPERVFVECIDYTQLVIRAHHRLMCGTWLNAYALWQL